MRSWRRLKECPVCGQPRCKENMWIVYCFRYQKAFNKKKIGVGIPKDLVLRPGVIEGRGPSKNEGQKELFQNPTSPYDFGE